MMPEHQVFKNVPCHACGHVNRVDSSSFFQCSNCGAPQFVRDWPDLPTEEEEERIGCENERRAQECARRVAREVIPLFRAKYEKVLKVFEHGIIRELPSGQTEIAGFDGTPRTLLGRWIAPFAIWERNYGTMWLPKYRQNWEARHITKRWTPPPE